MEPLYKKKGKHQNQPRTHHHKYQTEYMSQTTQNVQNSHQ